MTNWKKLIYSGSNAELNELTASSMYLSGIGDVSASYAALSASLSVSASAIDINTISDDHDHSYYLPMAATASSGEILYAQDSLRWNPSASKLTISSEKNKEVSVEICPAGNGNGNGKLFIGQSNRYGGGIIYQGQDYFGLIQNAPGIDWLGFYRREYDSGIVDSFVAGYMYNSDDFYFSGSVGIGISSPSEKLHVEGSVLIDAYNIGGASQGNEEGLFFRQGYTDTNKYNLSILTWDDGNGSPDSLQINAYDGIYFNAGSNTRDPKMFIKSDGKVGIGTTTPGELLTLSGSSPIIKIENIAETEAGIHWTDTNDPGAQYAKIMFNAAKSATGNLLNFYVSNTDPAITISGSSGHVGIGTGNPAYSLDFGENASTIRLVSENNGTAIRIGAGGGGNDVTLIRVDGNTDEHDGESDSSQLGFSLKYMGSRSSNNNSLSIFSDNQTAHAAKEALTVLQDGNIGIGATVPSRQLHVKDTAGTVAVRIEAADGSQASVDLENSEGAFRIINDGGALDFYDDAGSAVSRMYIQSGSGNVGIGTTSPATTLEVDGNIKAISFTGSLEGTASFTVTASHAISSVSASYAINATSASYALNAEGGTWYDGITYMSSSVDINVNGNISASGNITASDIRVENDVQVAGDLGIGGTIFGLSGFGVTIDDVAVTDGSTNFGSGSNPAISIHSRTGSMNITGSTFTFNGENVLTDSDVDWYNTGTELTASTNVGISGSLQVLGDITASSLTVRPPGSIDLVTFAYSSSQAVGGNWNFFPSLMFGAAGDAYIGRTDNATNNVPNNGINFDSNDAVKLGNGAGYSTNLITIQDASVAQPKILYNSPSHVFLYDSTTIMYLTESKAILVNALITGSLEGTASYALNASEGDSVWYDGTTYISSSVDVKISGSLNIIDTQRDLIKLHNTTNTEGAGIAFSDQTSGGQSGSFYYAHADADSNRAYNSFHFDSSEGRTAVIINETVGDSGYYIGSSDQGLDPSQFKVAIRGSQSSSFMGGNVGIGTTSPDAKLHVRGNDANYSDFSTWVEGNVGIEGSFISEYSGRTNNSTLPNGKEPTLVISEKLPGSDGLSFTQGVGNQITYRGGVSFGHGGPGIYSVNPNPAGSEYYGDIRFHTTAHDATLDNGNGGFGDFYNADRMVIKGDGKVGIGTTTPGSKLHISGGHMRIDSSGATDNLYLEFHENGDQRFKIYENSNNVYFDGGPGNTHFRPRQNGGSGNFIVGGAGLHIKHDTYKEFLNLDRTATPGIDQIVEISPSFAGTNNTTLNVIIGTGQFQFTEESRLGIGKLVPGYELDVNGTTHTKNMLLTEAADVPAAGTVALGQSTAEGLEIRTDKGSTTIGANNAKHSHFWTELPNFWFEKDIVLGTGKLLSYDNDDLILQRDWDDTSLNQITLGDNSFLIKLDNSNRLSINGAGKLTLGSYGSGTHTGTATKTLAVDSSGNVIEIDASTGTVSAVTNGADNRVATFTDGSALNGEANLTFDGSTLSVNGDISGKSVHNDKSFLYRFGGIFFTWDSDTYGTNLHHSITSTDNGAYSDDLTINSYGHVRINFDSNSNGTNTFSIGHASTGTTNTLLTLDESGVLSVGDLQLSSLSNQSSEATALTIDGSNNVGYRELGSNAFNSTAFLTSIPSAGPGAATYGSTADGTKIDQITLDAQGRVTNISTGATGTGDITGVTAGTCLSGGGTSGGVTLNVTNDSIGDTQLAYNTGQHLTTSSTPSFEGLIIDHGDGDAITINVDAETDASILFVDDDDVGGQDFEITYNASSEKLRFRHSDNDPILTLTNAGKIGIGTDSPAKTFDVRFSRSDTGVSGDKLSGGGDGNGILIHNESTTAGVYANLDFRAKHADARIAVKDAVAKADMHFILDTDTPLLTRMILQNDGDLHVASDIIAFSSTTSDRRLKTNIRALSSSLETVCKLEGVRYDWKHRPETNQLGVIAQQVEQHVPEVIHETKLPFYAPNEDDDTIYKTVRYEMLVPHLIEAIKELKAEVDELKSRLTDA